MLHYDFTAVPRHRGGFVRNIILAFAIAAFACIASAQQFPSRTVTLVSPFPPGGSTDAIARIMAQRMGVSLGQAVIVENSGGAGGSIGGRRAANARPDGYTFVIGQWDNFVANGFVYKLDYDVQADFAPIGLLSINPQLILARNGLAQDLKGLVAYMKANPGKVTFTNQQASAQLVAVMLQQMTGTEVLLVPYKGGGPAMTDMMAGHIDLLMVQAAVALPQVRAGKVKALAVLQPTRSPVVEGVPSVDEAGVPGLHLPGWFGFFAPKGTPREAIARLNAAMMDALADPAIRARFSELGLDIVPRERQTPEALAAFQKAEIEKWGPLIKAAGIKIE
jgi:tripartite-type tricarboxylate transporter receptor subunit TctC